jgi:hypothetical protein
MNGGLYEVEAYVRLLHAVCVYAKHAVKYVKTCAAAAWLYVTDSNHEWWWRDYLLFYNAVRLWAVWRQRWLNNDTAACYE